MEYKICDLMNVNRGASPRPIIEYLTDNGYRWLKISDFSLGDRYVYKTKEYIKEEGITKTKFLKKGTLILTNSATPGIPIFLGEDMCLHDGFLYFQNIKEEIISKEYLYYWFIFNRNNIVNQANGSVFKNLKKEIIMNLSISLPSLNTQKKVVKILNNIDNKIELNNQTNDNLYELSSTLYKKWYDSLSNDNITTLSKFDEMGKIVMGQSPKGESYNYYNEGLPLINGAADYENGFLKAQKYTTMPTKTCNKNDLIFCIRATIGLLTICDKEYCLGRGVAGIVNINDLYREYVFHLINNSIESFKNLATGSVIVGISRNDIQNIKVKIPSKEQIKKFHDIQKTLFDKMENIRQENMVLTQLRDTLLPKIMNGEIDLDKIEI